MLQSWLYAKFVALDANFRLRRKNVSSEQVDPGLSKGWSYFIEEMSYKAFIEERKSDTQEVCQSQSNESAYLMSLGSVALALGTMRSTWQIQKNPMGLQQPVLALSVVRTTT